MTRLMISEDQTTQTWFSQTLQVWRSCSAALTWLSTIQLNLHLFFWTESRRIRFQADVFQRQLFHQLLLLGRNGSLTITVQRRGFINVKTSEQLDLRDPEEPDPAGGSSAAEELHKPAHSARWTAGSRRSTRPSRPPWPRTVCHRTHEGAPSPPLVAEQRTAASTSNAQSESADGSPCSCSSWMVGLPADLEWTFLQKRRENNHENHKNSFKTSEKNEEIRRLKESLLQRKQFLQNLKLRLFQRDFKKWQN